MANANPEICDQELALDLAISQRLLPQIRGLFRTQAQKAFEEIEGILRNANAELTESIRVMDGIKDRESMSIAAAM